LILLREALLMERKTSLRNDETGEMAKPVSVASFQQFRSFIYDKSTVDMTSLRKACANGIPESRGLRSVVWKVKS